MRPSRPTFAHERHLPAVLPSLGSGVAGWSAPRLAARPVGRRRL